MYLFLCVSVLCLMFLCVIPVLCLWALLPELKLMMMMMITWSPAYAERAPINNTGMAALRAGPALPVTN